jgi:hypothetical protein
MHYVGLVPGGDIAQAQPASSRVQMTGPKFGVKLDRTLKMPHPMCALNGYNPEFSTVPRKS